MSALLEAILARADQEGDRIALDDGSRRISYADLQAAIRDMAELVDDEVRAPGPVAIDLENGIDWVIADLALLNWAGVHPTATLLYDGSAGRSAGRCRRSGDGRIEWHRSASAPERGSPEGDGQDQLYLWIDRSPQGYLPR